MTTDLVALCRRPPDRASVLAALAAAGPDLGVRADPAGTVVELLGPDDDPLLAIDGPLLVQVPGEVTRLLGPGLAEAPVWWVEIRAVSGRDDAVEVGRRFAARLVGALGGSVWP
jgi:hypothetical protein